MTLGRTARRAALLALTLAAYVPVMTGGGFVWDDDAYVTANATLRDLDGLARIWLDPGAVPQYYPLTFTSLWVDHHLWGTHPAGYHVVNVVLHAVNAILVWRVLALLALPGAWLAAAIFAVHPVHVESVAWITERKNVLSGVFYLLALLAYLRFAGLGAPVARRRVYALALGLFACALLAKTVTCTLPVVALLVLWAKRGTLTRRDVLPVLPFLAVGAVLAGVTVWMERHHVGAHGAAWALSLVDRVLIAGRALWFYAATLAWPRRLTFIYPRWTIDAAAWWQYVPPLAAALVVAVLVAARRRIGPWPLVAVLCFAVTLAPALGFVDVYPMRYSFVADHFQYLASAALIALAAAGIARGEARLRRAGRALAAERRVGAGAAAALLLVLAALTWRQARAYSGEETLWRDTLAKNPGAAMAYVNLGMVLHREGRLVAATDAFAAALRLDPADAEVHGDMGVTLASRGMNAEARRHLEEAVRLAPDAAEAHNNLANALVAAGDVDGALAHYREATRLRPDYADAHNNLANALVQRGDPVAAVAEYRAALRLDPAYVAAHYNLGALLAADGDVEGALREYGEAVRLQPEHVGARRALGAALAARGRVADAVPHFAAAARLLPGAADAHYELAAALAAVGRVDEAIPEYARALGLNPDSADVHNDLGVALAKRGDVDAAIGHFREAARLAPGNEQARDNLAAVLAERPRGTTP